MVKALDILMNTQSFIAQILLLIRLSLLEELFFFGNSTKCHHNVSGKYKTVQIEKKEMGVACSTYGGKNNVQGVGGET